MDDQETRREGAEPHSEACDSLDCPCYLAGQIDLARAYVRAQRPGIIAAPGAGRDE